MTIREEFYRLDTDRSRALDRKRECAAFTIPSMLPYEGKSIHTDLPVPFSMLPAEGANALASRITSVVFPLNGQSVFELLVDSPVAPQGRDDTELNAGMARLEMRVMDELAPTNLRSAVHLALKHAIVIGDCVVHMDDNLNFRVFRFDQFVVRRKHEGEWFELILCEAVLPDEEPDLPKGGTPNPTSPPYVYTAAHGEEWEALYTKVTKLPNGKVEVVQEFRDREVGRKVHDVSPYFPVRWGGVAGEPYGVSLVEDTMGDIRALDALAAALLDGVMLNAEYRWGVNPAGITDIEDLKRSINGDFVPASPGDVFPLQFQNAAQVQATFQALAHREQVVGRRFLMNSAVQPQGERVTARQVSLLAQELEGQLGGVLSMIARELQEPILRRVLYVMSRQQGDNGQPKLPKEIVDQINRQGGFVKMRIRAGLEILNREAEREKLDAAIERMRNLPPEALQVLNWPAIARDWWQSMGLETDGRVKTEQQLQQEQQAAQQQAMAQQAAMMGMQAAANRPTEETP